jgi:hypothetical protein
MSMLLKTNLDLFAAVGAQDKLVKLGLMGRREHWRTF